jgi:hypothetical protein
MKKLLLAASALALAVAVIPAATSPVQAQSAKSPYCNLAKGQKNLVGWNAHYHCLSPAAQSAEEARPQTRHMSTHGRRVYAQAQPESTKNPYCNMAKGQKNLVGWNAYYHCLNRQ